jgi:hypothetical protein
MRVHEAETCTACSVRACLRAVCTSLHLELSYSWQASSNLVSKEEPTTEVTLMSARKLRV